MTTSLPSSAARAARAPRLFLIYINVYLAFESRAQWMDAKNGKITNGCMAGGSALSSSPLPSLSPSLSRSLPFSTIHIKAQNSWTADDGEPNEQGTSGGEFAVFQSIVPNLDYRDIGLINLTNVVTKYFDYVSVLTFALGIAWGHPVRRCWCTVYWKTSTAVSILESYRGGAATLMDFAHYFWPFRVFHYFLLKLQREQGGSAERGRQNEPTLGMKVRPLK